MYPLLMLFVFLSPLSAAVLLDEWVKCFVNVPLLMLFVFLSPLSAAVLLDEWVKCFVNVL